MSARLAHSARGKVLRFTRLALVFGLAYFAVDTALNRFAFSSGWTILWPLNGVTIAILLRRRRADWPAILLGVAIGTGIGEFLDDNTLVSELWQRLFSVIEVASSACLLPRFRTLDRWLRTSHISLRFVACLTVGPALSGAMAAVLFYRIQNVPLMVGFNNWATADALGIAATLPLTLALPSQEMKKLFRGWALARTLGAVALASGVAWLIFGNSRYPLLFLLFPLLLLVDSLLSFPGAALLVAAVCLIAVFETTHGWGPFGKWPTDLPVTSDLALQFFLGFHIVALFPASLLFMERERMAQKLRISNEQLRLLAAQDGLTGVANRRSLDDRFEAEWRQALRVGSPLAAIMIDIDLFKQYNDHYGHQAGDLALQTVARELTAWQRRPEDFLARYGGEEFVVLLPNTGLEGARFVAEMLRSAVSELGIEHLASPRGSLTVSIGCAVCLPSPQMDPVTLLRAADSALYAAKRAGRNRACCEELVAEPESLQRLG